MALIGNYSVLNKTPGRFIGGATIAQNRSNWSTNGALKNSNLHYGKLAAFPSGYYPPYVWSMPISIGAMSSFTSSLGTLTPTANLAGGRNLTGSTSSVITLTNAQLDQIVTFIASGLMSIIGSGDLNASVNLQASAVLQLTVNADIQAIVNALASSSMAITPTAILTALAHMNAEAGGPTPLSPEGLAEAVWSSNLPDYIVTDSAGKIVQEIKSSLGKKLDTGTFIALK